MPRLASVRIERCASCERRFDVNFAERMEYFQKLHHSEQSHLWPCSFLQRRYYPTGMTAELFGTPWDEKPRVVFFHSEECEEAYCRSGSFDYVDCESCGRLVCEQNPANGWHWQFRDHSEIGYVCLRCYEKEVLENGQPASDFVSGSIRGGMFFSSDNHEPTDAGFAEVPGFETYFISSEGDALRYNAYALALTKDGHKVVTGFERLAIGGLEGYVTMFMKPRAKEFKHLESRMKNRVGGRSGRR